METTQEAKAACAPERKKENRLLTIFTVMFKTGCVTFGGGWGIIAQMQEEFVDRRGWIEEEDLIDFLSLGRSFPGIMIINTSVIFGYTVAGFWGAVLAAFGLSLPALISIAVVTYFYSAIKSNVIVARALSGVRCAVIPIILGAALRLREKSLTGKSSYVLAAIALFVCTFTKVNKILVVLGGAVFGLLALAVKRGGRHG